MWVCMCLRKSICTSVQYIVSDCKSETSPVVSITCNIQTKDRVLKSIDLFAGNQAKCLGITGIDVTERERESTPSDGQLSMN